MTSATPPTLALAELGVEGAELTPLCAKELDWDRLGGVADTLRPYQRNGVAWLWQLANQ